MSVHSTHSQVALQYPTMNSFLRNELSRLDPGNLASLRDNGLTSKLKRVGPAAMELY